jgi:hypothetical protein
VDYAALMARYASLDTEQLVALHQSGTLLSEAYPALESELARRGIALGARPAEFVPPPEPPFFAGYWSGSQTAASANLFVAAFVPAVMAGCFALTYKVTRLVLPASTFVVAKLPGALALAMLAYCIFGTVAIWRCARNEPSARRIYLARYKGLRVLAIFAIGAALLLGKSLGFTPYP